MKKTKETSDGIIEYKKGYQTLTRDPEFQKLRDLYKIPFSCHACNKLMENWDDSSFYRNGVCSPCEVSYIFDRDLPEELEDRALMIEYVRDCIKEKESRNSE